MSLDTCDEAAFDRARGLPGAFAAATAALRLCAGAGMLTFINCVVGPGRLSSRAEIVRFLRFVEAIDPRVVVNFLPQLSTGRGAAAESFERPADCDAAADRLVETARSIGRPTSMLFGRVDQFIGCPGAGGKLMNIDVAGNVTVCISRASLGSVLDEPFEALYQRYVARCARLKVGFFCCEISRDGGGELLGIRDSEAALRRFFRRTDDAEWQTVLDQWGWLLTRLLPRL